MCILLCMVDRTNVNKVRKLPLLRKIGLLAGMYYVKLSSYFYFRNPFTLPAMFVMMIFYCLFVWCLRRQ